MFHPLLLAMLTAAPADATPTQVREAALFKNGYAFVTREIKLDSSGKTRITSLPQVTYGSLWLTATSGVTITSAVNKLEPVEGKATAGSLVQFLVMNIGKKVELELRNPGQNAVFTLRGVLKNITESFLLIRDEKGATVTAAVADIIRATVTDEAVLERTFTTSQRVIEINARGAGNAMLYGIEPGLSWTPHYFIDVTDPKKMKLVLRCTVVNNLADLKGATLRFVTGSPNIRYLGSIDPFTEMAMAAGTGGFGGGGGTPGRAGMQNVASDASMMKAEGMESAFETGGEGETIGDLYFYSLKDVQLKAGERGYYVLFSQEHAYDYLYTVEYYDGQREGVQTAVRTLRFTNNGDKPLTSASALMVSDGQMVGQDELRYTAKGQEALVAVSSALDIRSEILEEEIARERQALRRADNAVWDLVTVRGTIEVKNMKSEAVPMRIRKRMTGEVVETSAGKATKSASGLNQINANSMIEWSPTLKPGETAKLTYKYRVYVN